MIPSFLVSVSLNNIKFPTRVFLGDIDSWKFDEMQLEDTYYCFNSLPKFENEKLIFETEKLWVFLDGLILNLSELKNEFGQKDFKSCLVFLISKYQQGVFHLLKGPFILLVIDKEKQSCWGGSDLMGNKQLYFTQKKGYYLFSNSIFLLNKARDRNSQKPSLDPVAAYQMLTLGYLLEDRTLLREVKKLKTGYSFYTFSGKIFLKRLYRWGEATTQNLSKDQIIATVNDLFSKAVKLQFNMDRKYHFDHLVSLSAGLDSRMTTFVAHHLGYGKKITNYTFSQSRFFDHQISKKIAKFLNHSWVFNPLDEGEILFNFREISALNDSMAIFYGSSHAWDTMKQLDTGKFGIVHTGQLGDVILGGSYEGGYFEPQKDLFWGAYSKQLQGKLSDFSLNDSYSSRAQFLLYNRGMNFIQLGNRPLQVYFESISPFLDLDFVKFCDFIPKDYLVDNKLYDQWLLNYYPEAARFLHNGRRRIGERKQRKIKIGNFAFYHQDLLRKLWEKIVKKSAFSTFDMNPVASWYHSNEELKKISDEYVQDHLNLLDDWPELKNDAFHLYNQSFGKEKCQVITLLTGAERLLK
jgi:asparagine synthase (glutamine-hydrolysing)